MVKKITDLDDIAEQITDLGTLIGAKVDKLDSRMDGLDGRMDKLDGRMDGLDSRMDNLENSMGRLEERMTDQEKATRELRDWVASIDSRLAGIEGDVKEIYDRIVALERKPHLSQKEYKEMERKLSQLIVWARAVSQKTGIKLPQI